MRLLGGMGPGEGQPVQSARGTPVTATPNSRCEHQPISFLCQSEGFHDTTESIGAFDKPFVWENERLGTHLLHPLPCVLEDRDTRAALRSHIPLASTNASTPFFPARAFSFLHSVLDVRAGRGVLDDLGNPSNILSDLLPLHLFLFVLQQISPRARLKRPMLPSLAACGSRTTSIPSLRLLFHKGASVSHSTPPTMLMLVGRLGQDRTAMVWLAGLLTSLGLDLGRILTLLYG